MNKSAQILKIIVGYWNTIIVIVVISFVVNYYLLSSPFLLEVIPQKTLSLIRVLMSIGTLPFLKIRYDKIVALRVLKDQCESDDSKIRAAAWKTFNELIKNTLLKNKKEN